MVIPNEHLPLLPGNTIAVSLSRAAFTHHDLRDRTAMHERAGVHGILKEFQDLIVNGESPGDVASGTPVLQVRKRNLFLSVPQQDLPRRSQLAELGKHPTDRLLDLAIGDHLHAVVPVSYVAHGLLPERLSPSDHFPQCFLSPLPQQPQLKFGHAAFEAQK